MWFWGTAIGHAGSLSLPLSYMSYMLTLLKGTLHIFFLQTYINWMIWNLYHEKSNSDYIQTGILNKVLPPIHEFLYFWDIYHTNTFKIVKLILLLDR